jgi:dinuclear metal center YbgI/SA1388 family protein
MASLREIIDYCDRRLSSAGFEDYCPNGLQVEACRRVGRIVTGVTASLDLIEKAAALEADLLLVHHGYFWKGEAQPLTGMKGRRIAALYRHGLSLAAYHLPLDVHPQLGNNARLGRLLGIEEAAPVAEGELLWGGAFATPLTPQALAGRLRDLTAREPLLLDGGAGRIDRLAWCTGAAQGLIDRAADLGFPAYLSGEVSESTLHVARERRIHYFAAGHHATERYGVQALGDELAREFGLFHRFVDLPNPV